MKFELMILSLVFGGSLAFAEVSNVSAHRPSTVQGTTELSLDSEDLELENDKPLWNLNLGLSRFADGNYGGETFNGSGIALEIQKKIRPLIYLGASYTAYKTKSTHLESTGGDRLDVVTISAEAHPIDLSLAGNFNFFAAVNAGGLFSTENVDFKTSGPNFFYGAGVGFNYRNQLGLRADLKSNRDFKDFASVSLVGYY
jgi:hypothetical protein